MNHNLLIALEDIKSQYEFGVEESKILDLSVEYTKDSTVKLIDRVSNLYSPVSNKKWTIPRCEKFCRDFGLSIEVQAFLEEFCLWLMYGLQEFKDNMKYNAQSILREIEKYKSKK